MWVGWLMVACGWRWGSPPVPAMSVAPVQTSAPVAGWAPAVRAALLQELAAAHATPGPDLEVTISASESPSASTASAWVAQDRWRIDWRLVDVDGCSGTLEGRFSWDAPRDAIDPAAAREAGARDAADTLAARIISAVVANPACRR